MGRSYTRRSCRPARAATATSLCDAQSMQIAPGVSVRVASLIDLIRLAESSPDAAARSYVPALWATLEMRQREPQDAHPRQGRPPRP